MGEISITALAGSVPAWKPNGRMARRVCLVTRGGSGIGRATAQRFALEAAQAVAIAGRRKAEGEAIAAELVQAGTPSLFVPTDVAREDDLVRLVSITLERFGRLDVAFNNAGFQERRAKLAEQDDATYTKVFDTNLRGLFHAMRHQIPAMLECGAGTGGDGHDARLGDCRHDAGGGQPAIGSDGASGGGGGGGVLAGQ